MAVINTWLRKPLQTVFLCLLSTALVEGQPLTRSVPDRDFLSIDNPLGYANYGVEPYSLYPALSRRIPRYDRMGNFLMVGDLGYSVDESRPGLSRFGGTSRTVQQIILNYAVIRDSYRGAGYSLMVLSANPNIDARQLPEGVRTRFSPLTLNITRYAGVRFDVHGLRNQGTFLYSRGAADRKRFSYFAPGRDERSPVNLWGGHWQSTVGTVFQLGTTFVNQHLTDTTVRQGSIFRGNIPYEMRPPKTMYVRVTDDSPDDRSSAAAVYSLSLLLEGLDSQGKMRRMTNDPALAVAGVELDPSLRSVTSGRRAGDHFEARGSEEKVEIAFELPKDFQPQKVEFVAVVGGDYRIGIRQVHDFVPGGSTTPTPSAWPSTARANQFERAFLTKYDPRYPTDFKFPEKDPTYTVVRSEGNAWDLSQRRTVRFTYGMPTAQTLAGSNFSFQYKGYNLDGEVAVNLQDFKFPVEQGRRDSKFYPAYFLKGSGEVPYLAPRYRPQVGGEVYSIPAAYSGGYDAKRGGAVFFTEVAPFPPGAMTQEFNLCDDNDDGDQWADDSPNDSPLSDARDAGVFPGQDEDRDYVVDTDRNANGKPDWTEPFLFYDSDPPEFIYDVDFNNNDMPDMTENDDEADYPYRKGQHGYHGFMNFPHLTPAVARLAVGYYRAEEPAGGGENTGCYARLEAQYARPGIGRIEVEDLLKRVKDSIPDPTYIWQIGPDPTVNMLVVQSKDRSTAGDLIAMRPPPPDPMLMRNSTVNTAYLEAQLDFLSGVEVRSRNKVVVNRQHADVFAVDSTQSARTLYRWTLSNRISYTRQVSPSLSVGVRAKHLLRWDGGYPGTAVRFSVLAPVAEAAVKITKKMRAQFGQEGWPLLPFWYADLTDSVNNYRQWTSLFLVRTDWQYWGWNMTLETGMQWQWLRTELEKTGQRTFFFEIYVGF